MPSHSWTRASEPRARPRRVPLASRVRAPPRAYPDAASSRSAADLAPPSPPPLPRSSSQIRASDRNRKKVEYPEIKEEEKPPVMTVMSEK